MPCQVSFRGVSHTDDGWMHHCVNGPAEICDNCFILLARLFCRRSTGCSFAWQFTSSVDGSWRLQHVLQWSHDPDAGVAGHGRNPEAFVDPSAGETLHGCVESCSVDDAIADEGRSCGHLSGSIMAGFAERACWLRWFRSHSLVTTSLFMNSSTDNANHPSCII